MVKLKSYTQPTIDMILEGVEDIQDLIAYCAKVSNPAAQINKETSEKLIKYLIKHKHWSPLEMVDATIEIETTRDIAHQIVRHRSFSFQEFSQRYADPNEMGEIFILSQARLQDPKNRQNSVVVDDMELQLAWDKEQLKVSAAAEDAYNWAIENGIAKEQARKVLPEGITKTRLYMKGSLRSWLHYIELRSANGTQKEHMDIAIECAKEIARIFPLMNDL